MIAAASENREALVDWARDVIAQGSQSFAVASKLFSRSTRERTWLLYSWCRTADDMTDGQRFGHETRKGHNALAAQAELEARTMAALDGEEPVSPPFAALRQVVGETGIPRSFLCDHIEGFALDAQGWRPADVNDLLQYCYHVAGSVGCMMAVVMGVDPADDDTLDRACDLGIAFQLANIARDIIADAQVGRCYLPESWLAEHNLPETDISAEYHRHELAEFARRLVGLAAAYRISARVGAARLSLRSRFAVLAADAIYGAIGEKVVGLGSAAWNTRVSVGYAGKLYLFMRSAMRCCVASCGTDSRAGLWTRPRQRPADAGPRS